MLKRFIKNSFYTMVYLLIGIPLGYMVRLLLTKELSLEQFGLFYGILGFYTFISSINDFGFTETQIFFVSRYIHRKEFHKVKAAIYAQLMYQMAASLLCSVPIFFFARYISLSIFHIPYAEPVLLIMLLYFIASDFLRCTQTLYSAFQESEIISSFEPIRQVMCLLGIFFITLCAMQSEYQMIAWLWSAVYVFLAIIYFVLFFSSHTYIFQAKSYSILKIYSEYLPYSLPTFFANNTGLIYSFSISILLPMLKNIKEVALYNVSYPIASILLSLISPIATLLFPITSRFDEAKNVSSIQNMILIVINSGIFFLLPLVTLITLYSQESIYFLFGHTYLNADVILKIFPFYFLFLILNRFLMNILVGLGLQKKKLRILGITSCVNLISAIIFIPKFGAIGAVTSGIVSEILIFFFVLAELRKKVFFDIPKRNYIKILFLISIFILFHLVLKPVTSQNLFFQMILVGVKVALSLALYYGIGIYACSIIDRKFIHAIVKKIV